MPDRVFVAIDLDERTRASLAAATAAVLRADPSWAGEKPVAPLLLHVTIAFVGPVPDAALDALIGRLRRATGTVDPFELTADGVRAMPSASRANMVWATFADPGARAGRLATTIADAAGLPDAPHPFRPHVTLIRARRPRGIAPAAIAAAEHALSETGKEADRIVSVRSATVYSSTLGASGPTYAALATVYLEGEGATARSD
jgi:2'-5' RNA ligase